jgi:hypothetical protein
MFANDLEEKLKIGDIKKLSADDTVGVRQRTVVGVGRIIKSILNSSLGKKP